MQRRRRRKAAPKNVFGSLRLSSRTMRKPTPPPIPRTRARAPERPVERSTEASEVVAPEEEDWESEEELGFPSRPTFDDVVRLVTEVIGETDEVDSNVTDVVSSLIKPQVISIMTEPETKGLGLLVGEISKEAGRRYWTVPERGLLCTDFEGVSLIIDVNQTVSQKIRSKNNHLELYVSPQWHTGWHEDARRVCLVGRRATATDFVYAMVMIRNSGTGPMNHFFADTDLRSTIRKVRGEKERRAALERQRDTNQKETGIRETDEERQAREEREAQMDANEKETGIRETDRQRGDREEEERRTARELARLRQLRRERERALDMERDSNEKETGIRETHWERNDRETRERWDRKVSGWYETVSSELESLEARIAGSECLSSDSELQRRVSETRRCMSEEMWWAAYSSVGLASKRASHIEEQTA